MAEVLTPADIVCPLFSGISIRNIFRFRIILVSVTLCSDHKYPVSSFYKTLLIVCLWFLTLNLLAPTTVGARINP